MALSKPLVTEFGIHHRLESCVAYMYNSDGLYLLKKAHQALKIFLQTPEEFYPLKLFAIHTKVTNYDLSSCKSDDVDLEK